MCVNSGLEPPTYFDIIPKTESSLPSSARAVLAANPFMPTSVRSQISDWLHDTPPPSPPHLDASTGYLHFTRLCATQGLLTRNSCSGTDSVFREVGSGAEISRGLATDDAVRDDTRHLFFLPTSDVMSAWPSSLGP